MLVNGASRDNGGFPRKNPDFELPSRLPVAVARTRSAVGAAFCRIPRAEWVGKPPLVLLACSGGPDSMALMLATVFVAKRLGWECGLVVVNHQLLPSSAEVAERTVELAREWGIARAETVSVSVLPAGDGEESAARTARYEAIDRIADEWQATAIFLGHTRDDQAETVLLGLARGSGARSLSGMPKRRGRYHRPFLELSRKTVHRACRDQGVLPWQDPSNTNDVYLRARVRSRVLPFLEEQLGPGVAKSLARTAVQLREDADYLEGLSRDRLAEVCREGQHSGQLLLAVSEVASLPDALRLRVIMLALKQVADNISGHHGFTRKHVLAVDDLVSRWHGQRQADLPGGVRAWRERDLLFIEKTPLPS